MGNLLRVFPNEKVAPVVDHTDGLYIYTKQGKKLLDTTGGSTSHAVLGGNNRKIITAMQEQMSKFCHIDYKAWSDENTEQLATILASKAEHGLKRIYFAGSSGAEACEAAMKMSYQTRYDTGKKEKTWFISRTQSYHGSTTDAMALGERPNLNFYQGLFPKNRAKIPQHHPLYLKKEKETLDEYAKRSASELEDKILEIGPDKVCGFLAETMMGGLIGNVPPAPNYWRYIRKVCNKYDVHLILDEVFCGTGSSGKIYCIDWDGITPDFIFMGKTLAAGYAPISVVVTSDKIYDIIKQNQGRLQHTTTYQAYSLGVAAALAAQQIIHDEKMLTHINQTGDSFIKTLSDELGFHSFFRDIRGRGLRFSLEYSCPQKNEFGLALQKEMETKYDILIDAKWHRVTFSPAFIITKEQANEVLEKFIKTFKTVSARWDKH